MQICVGLPAVRTYIAKPGLLPRKIQGRFWSSKEIGERKMKLKITKKGVWSETEICYEIDDDEIVNILEKVLAKMREDEVQRLLLVTKLDELKEDQKQ